MTAWVPKPSLKSPFASEQEPELKDPAKFHLAVARYMEEAGYLVQARKSYEETLDADPKAAEAMLGLARLDQLNGRTGEAEQRFLKALRMKPNDAVVLDSVGQFYASQGRWERAIGLLRQAMQAEPENSLHRYNLAVALARAGNVEQSMPHFAQTVGLAEGHYNVGYILYQKGDLAAAERHFRQAVAKRPNLVQAQRMLASIHNAPAKRPRYAGRRPSPRPSARTAARPEIGTGRGSLQAAGYQRTGQRQSSASGAQPGHAAPPRQTSPLQRPVTVSPRSYSREANRWGEPAPTYREADATGSPARQQDAYPAADPADWAQPRQPTPEQIQQWQNQMAP